MVRRWLAMLLLLMGCTASPTMARAQVLPAGTPVTVCVARRDMHRLPATLLRDPASFDCHTPQTAFGPGDFDVLSAPLARDVGVASPAHVRFASLWQRSVTLYALYADGAVVRIRLDQHGLSRQLQLGATIDQPLPFRRVAVRRVLWRVAGSLNLRGTVLGPAIATEGQGWRADLLMSALYAAFGGLCVALLVYNFALWCALRHRFQLAYCAMVLALMAYAFCSSGALAWAWPAIANNDRMRLSYLSLAAAAAAALAFARAYFEPEVFAGRVGQLASTVTIMLLGSATLVALLAPWHADLLDKLYSASFLALLAIVGPVLVRARRVRSNYLWLFACAWALPIGFAAVRLAASTGLVAWSPWIDNSTVLAMGAEGLLSSIAIAYRIHLLSRERDHAREQEFEARLLADTDPLTGLLNRRAFLSRAIGREGTQMLMLVDIDHFKRVNETIGHDGGDEVLRVFARVLRQQLPDDALVARLGGEEFAVVAAGAAPIEPTQVIGRLRAARMPFDLAVTASIGVCTGPLEREVDWKKLYRRADQALFEAKAAGRDRARSALPVAA